MLFAVSIQDEFDPSSRAFCKSLRRMWREQERRNHSNRDSLNLVLGSWVDERGSAYDVVLDKHGSSCTVTTTRRSGECKSTRALIRLVDDHGGRASCIHWGARFALEVETASPSQIHWKAADGGKDFVWWRTQGAVEIAAIAPPIRREVPRSAGKTQQPDEAQKKYAEALDAWGVSRLETGEVDLWSSGKVPGEVMPPQESSPSRPAAGQSRTFNSHPWPSWAEVEALEADMLAKDISPAVACRRSVVDRIVEYLMAKPDLFEKRKEVLLSCVGGCFGGHEIHAVDTEQAIAEASKRLSSGAAHTASNLAEAGASPPATQREALEPRNHEQPAGHVSAVELKQYLLEKPECVEQRAALIRACVAAQKPVMGRIISNSVADEALHFVQEQLAKSKDDGRLSPGSTAPTALESSSGSECAQTNGNDSAVAFDPLSAAAFDPLGMGSLCEKGDACSSDISSENFDES